MHTHSRKDAEVLREHGARERVRTHTAECTPVRTHTHMLVAKQIRVCTRTQLLNTLNSQIDGGCCKDEAEAQEACKTLADKLSGECAVFFPELKFTH